MSGYIPESDAEFDTWQETWFAYVNANGPALGLTTAQVNDVGAAHNAWIGNYGAQQTALNAAQTATSAKNAARDGLEALIRALTALIQANPATTDDQRNALGVTVPGAAPAPPDTPSTRPTVSVDAPQRLTHVVNWVDELTPASKAKPAGVDHAELWLYVGATPPAGPSAFSLVATDRKTPYLYEFDEADAGKAAYWDLRWISTHDNHGPWSQTVSATVGG